MKRFCRCGVVADRVRRVRGGVAVPGNCLPGVAMKEDSAGGAIAENLQELEAEECNSVSAQLSAGGVNDTADVVYSGAVERLPKAPTRTRLSYLRLLFERVAGETDGRFEEEMDGDIDLPDILYE